MNYHEQEFSAYYAEMDSERELDTAGELGLCVHCCSNPVNPALSDIMCLECFTREKLTNVCDVEGCPNAARGEYRQAELCAIHLTDTIHSEYNKYCRRQSKLLEEEQRLDDKLSDCNVDPRRGLCTIKGASNQCTEAYTEWMNVQAALAENRCLKDDIKQASENLDQPFPEDFDASF